MKPFKLLYLISGMLVFMTAISVAHPSYIGYSGAPGARGLCSTSCHERHNFASSVTVTGFPEFYTPGQQYTITVTRQSGNAIKQFNASIRIGTSSQNAGVIAAGTSTATYNHAQETNGIHWTTNDRPTGTFLWTAPASGTGEVRLYWAGLQGSLSSGSDTSFVLISNEMATGIDENIQLPVHATLDQNYPNPFNAETIIKFYVPAPGDIKLEILNILGQKVHEWQEHAVQSGEITYRWNGVSADGNPVPSGVYFYRLQTDDSQITRRMTLLR